MHKSLSTLCVLSVITIGAARAMAGSTDSFQSICNGSEMTLPSNPIHFTGEEFCWPRITRETPQNSSLGDQLEPTNTDNLVTANQTDIAPAPLAIAPLPPAVLTGSGMLLGGALIKIFRKVRMG